MIVINHQIDEINKIMNKYHLEDKVEEINNKIIKKIIKKKNKENKNKENKNKKNNNKVEDKIEYKT